jgi:aminopeptidase
VPHVCVLTRPRARNPAQDVAPIIFVGKGITFDSGGISIKPSEGMGMMRGDMGGAAAVVSTLWALASLQIKTKAICLTPLCGT